LECFDSQLDAVVDVEKGRRRKLTMIRRCRLQEVVEPQGGADETPCVNQHVHPDGLPVNIGDVQQ